MSSRIRLAGAEAADAGALAEAGSRLFAQAYARYSRPDDLEAHVEEYFGRQSVAEELEKRGVSYTMAYDGDAIAGFIKTRRGAAPDSIPAVEAIEVQQLYVDANRQRKGVGRALMDSAVAAAREEDAAGLWLSVWQDAEWATAFYDAYGFRRVGTAEFQLGQSCFMDYLMWLALDSVDG
jgi:ribosomal protein S18 acetylase RimI-like enzyme